MGKNPRYPRFYKGRRNSSDMLRPTVAHDGVNQFIVYGRKPMFGHQGPAVELFKTTNREEAYAKLKEISEAEENLTNQRLQPVHTIYGSFGVKNDIWKYVVVLLLPDKPPQVEGGSHMESAARKILVQAAEKHKGHTVKLILCRTGRELASLLFEDGNAIVNEIIGLSSSTKV